MTLDATGSSDADGDDLSFSWTLDAPEGSSAALSDDATEQPTFTPDVEGNYTATVTVDDGNGETDDANVTVTAEQQDIVEVNNNITSDDTWTAGSIYRVIGTVAVQGAQLTIEPGVRVEFESDAGLWVDGNVSSLVAVGTSSNPVVMTGAQEQAGFWHGIGFFSNNSQNEMAHVEIAYGGGDAYDLSYGDVAANIAIDSNGYLKLTNSTIENSAAWGVYVKSNATLDDSNNTYNGNADGGVDYE